MSKNNEDKKLSDKEKLFVEEYLVDLNASAAARRCGYAEKSAGVTGKKIRDRPHVKKYIDERFKEKVMSAEEAMSRITDWTRAAFDIFFKEDEIFGGFRIDLTSEEAKQNMHLIKKVKTNEFGVVTEIELHDQMAAADKILKLHGKYIDRHEVNDITPKEWDDSKGSPKDYINEVLKK